MKTTFVHYVLCLGAFLATAELMSTQVRGVVFVDAETVFSASRDATVRLWKLLSPKPPSYDCTLISHGSAFVNSIAFIPPSSEFPEGLVISGGKDMIIEVKKPTKTSQEHSDALLLGHSHNVCALDVDEDGRTIVSGSWDAEARIWEVGKWETSAVLQGHNGSVWAVLMYDHNTVLTGANYLIPNQILIKRLLLTQIASRLRG